MLLNCAANFAYYAEKWLCIASHGKGSTSRVLADHNGQNLDFCIRNLQKQFQGDPMVNESKRRECYWGM